jgi:hypothetical protein
MSAARPLTLFVRHRAELLTDHQPHGDGLGAHGGIRHFARRGRALYVAAVAHQKDAECREAVGKLDSTRNLIGTSARVNDVVRRHHG